VATSRPLVHKVDVDAVELGAELIEGIELALLPAPVELLGPVREERPQELEVDSLAPRIARRWLGPARVADACSKVGQNLVIDSDRKGLDAQR
jgi:hypothetical protein